MDTSHFIPFSDSSMPEGADSTFTPESAESELKCLSGTYMAEMYALGSSELKRQKVIIQVCSSYYDSLEHGCKSVAQEFMKEKFCRIRKWKAPTRVVTLLEKSLDSPSSEIVYRSDSTLRVKSSDGKKFTQKVEWMFIQLDKVPKDFVPRTALDNWIAGFVDSAKKAAKTASTKC